MGWLDEQADKIKEIGGIVVTITLDAALIVFAAYLYSNVQYLVEVVIFKIPIDQINPFFKWSYYCAKFILPAFFTIYAIGDVAKLLIRKIKEVRNEIA